MSVFDLIVYLLKFYIPAAWSILFRAVAFGYVSKRRVALGFALYTAYVLTVPALLISLMGYGEYTHIAAFVMMIGSMAVLVFSTDTLGKTIFLQLAQGGMITAMSVVLNMVRTIFNLSYPMLLLMLLICSPILFFVALRYFAKPMRFFVDSSQDSILSLLTLPLLTLPLLTLIMVSIIPIYPPQNFANHPVFCTFLMLSTESIFFVYLYTMYRSLCRISVLSRTEARSELLRQEVASYQSYLETARENRHDLRHHDAFLLERLESGDTVGAIEYLRDHDKELAGASLKRFCAEPMINAVLRIYERRASAAGVVFSAMAELPKSLPFAGPELSGLLGNLLENALYAASSSGDNNPFIVFAARVEDDSLLLELKNTANGRTEFRNGLPISQKPGGGIGTRSVVTTVKKYGGLSKFFQKRNEFCVRIILPLSN